ncbi:MAG: ribosome maturation factor RimM [Bacteroidota bacterium]|nr:ribosome maturation factor RimM [Bacteroidota bacterium]
MDKSDCQLIGTLAKLHGYKGEYILVAESFLSEEINNWESVLLDIDGLLVPFFISSLNISSDTSAIIGFEDVNTSEKAKEFVTSKVYQLKSKAGDGQEDDISPNMLTGYKVTDKKTGALGTIDQLLDYNQNLLFSVVSGEREILIPVSNEIIVKVNHRKKEILINAPEGLLDLYL